MNKEDFSLFNIKSKVQLIEKDGKRLNLRIVLNQYLVSVYEIYDFVVELVYDLELGRVIKVDLVINSDIIGLYNDS